MTDETTAEWYRRFAAHEAAGVSPVYERLALAVADDEQVLSLLQQVPEQKRQPNLLFGALRLHDIDVADPGTALQWVLEHSDVVVEVLRTRRTQTNEVARCGVLLPVLAQVGGPLALVEVGASAGLCLLYDRWSYRYGDRLLGDGRLVLEPRLSGPVPVPTSLPEIVWRVGLDLNPLDAGDPETRRWLQALVWPEHHDRAERLASALAIAAEDPPRIVHGDLISDLERLLDEAPAGATVVVTHSACLTYLSDEACASVVALLRARGVTRIGLEGPAVLPHLEVGPDVHTSVVSRDNRVLALAQGHGRSLHWL